MGRLATRRNVSLQKESRHGAHLLLSREGSLFATLAGGLAMVGPGCLLPMKTKSHYRGTSGSDSSRSCRRFSWWLSKMMRPTRTPKSQEIRVVSLACSSTEENIDVDVIPRQTSLTWGGKSAVADATQGIIIRRHGR